MQPSDFYDLVSGRRRGIWPSVQRCGLSMGEFAYRMAVNYRNRRFDRGSKVEQVDATVISVGNLTLGGTGKTPMVKWIARQLRQGGHRVAILSRGYGATDGAKNDEALELEQSLPDVPHLQSPDRVAIARTAIEELESQVLLLDDGFQHRRLARDLDIVLLDATQPFGFDHVFPRGTLREPESGLSRADVVCLSRANLIGEQERSAIRDRATELAPEAIWCEVAHAPATLLNSNAESLPIDQLQGKRVFGFCGIGNPAAFRSTLESAGANIVGWCELPDHHAYTAQDVGRLSETIQESTAELAVCTQKDLVKLRIADLAEIPLWAVVVEIEFLVGQDQMHAILDAATEAR